MRDEGCLAVIIKLEMLGKQKQNNQMTARCVHRTGETMIHQWVSLCSLPQHNWEPKCRDGQLNLLHQDVKIWNKCSNFK